MNCEFTEEQMLEKIYTEHKLSVKEFEEIGYELEEVNEKIESEHRWYTWRSTVIIVKDKFFEYCWMCPASESQEGQDMFDDDFVEFEEVIQVEKIVKVWVKKEIEIG